MQPMMQPGMMQQVPGQMPQQPVQEEKPAMPIGALVGLIIASLVAVTFVGLFIWMTVRYNTVKGREDVAVNAAVSEAVSAKTKELEAEFTEREKYPYKTFAGPIDYGELTFEYPKTWSMYEASDAALGGDYEAYINPDKVRPVSDKEVSAAIRVMIKDQTYDKFVKNYDNYVKNGKMSVSVRTINGENANIYVGEIPSSKLQGAVAIFKIRDKVCAIQTDAMIFFDDLNKILDTVNYTK